MPANKLMTVVEITAPELKTPWPYYIFENLDDPSGVTVLSDYDSVEIARFKASHELVERTFDGCCSRVWR